MDSFGFVEFIRAPLGVVGFIRGRLVHSGSLGSSCALCGSSGSCIFVGFIRARPGGGGVHLGSFRRALMVLGLIRFRWVYSGASLAWLVSIRLVGFS